MPLFCARLFRDNPAFEPAMLQLQKLRILPKLRENMQIARKLLHEGDSEDSVITEQEKTVLDMVATMKRRASSASIT